MGKAFLIIVAAFVGVILLVTLLRDRAPVVVAPTTPAPQPKSGWEGIFSDIISGLPAIVSSFRTSSPTPPSVGAKAPVSANDVYRPSSSSVLYA